MGFLNHAVPELNNVVTMTGGMFSSKRLLFINEILINRHDNDSFKCIYRFSFHRGWKMFCMYLCRSRPDMTLSALCRWILFNFSTTSCAWIINIGATAGFALRCCDFTSQFVEFEHFVITDLISNIKLGLICQMFQVPCICFLVPFLWGTS